VTIVGLAAVTTGTAIGVVTVIVGAVTLLVRVLEFLDASARPDGVWDDDEGGTGGGGTGGGDEPPWWPDFERELADYLASTASAASR
jgi:hypothetical protein